MKQFVLLTAVSMGTGYVTQEGASHFFVKPVVKNFATNKNCCKNEKNKKVFLSPV